jgi:prolycopene isomerase
MAEQYDVIVIGAGLGGLAAAASLAKAGLGVALFEKHTVPGGYASSFVRGRYEFEVSLHELSGIGHPGHPGPFYRLLSDLGITDKVTFLPIKDAYRTVLPGLDMVLPCGRQAYQETLIRQFPREAKGIKTFLDRVFSLAKEIEEFTSAGGRINPLKIPFMFPNILRYLPAVWGDVLDRDVADPMARAVLSQYWGYFGNGPSTASFFYFAPALAGYLAYGPAYVKGRSQALSNAFVQVIEAAGGTVRFATGIRHIITAGDAVHGVVTEGGEVFEADYIVSNADPVTTCARLIGTNRIDRSFFASLGPARIATSTINIYLGVARTAEELGFRCHENFVNKDEHFDAHAAMMKTIGAPGATLVTCYNTVDPQISPPGTSMVVLTSLFRGEPWVTLDPERYVSTKMQVADAMIRDAERIAPDIRKYAEVVEVATPLTNVRYTGNLGGSIYGFGNEPTYHTVLRQGYRGPLKGLYFVGAWTQPGGGFEPAITSGILGAAMVVGDRKGVPVRGLV